MPISASDAGVPMRRHEPWLDHLHARWAKIRPGETIPHNNLRQADVPVGATPILQRRGTAPGLIVPVGRKVVYAVPGVPHEMQEMLERAVLPAFIRRQLEKGGLGGLGLRVDDCRKTYAELSAKGVTFLQEPSDRPYGVEAVMRDNTGNWLVLVEPRAFTPADLV